MCVFRQYGLRLVSAMVAAGLAGVCLAAYALASDEGGPSVILIIIDTLRADHLGCHGYERATSPNIDKFSSEAVFFKNAISPSPWTSPAIGSFFTAQYPHVMGYEDEVVVLDDKFLCMAEIFRNNGYQTKGVISHIYLSSDLGFDQGFETFDQDNAQGHGHISSVSVTDKGIAFVDEYKDDKFFLFLHYFDPHCDYILHEPYDYYPGYEGSLRSGQPIEDLRKKAPGMSAEDVRYLNALYDSEIRFTDEHIGRFLSHLKDLGIYDDALIVIVADHGEGFLERGDFWIGHTKTVYQELIHVPFMVRLPGMVEGRTIEEYVSLIDFMPTVVAAAGLEIPEGYEHDGEAIDLTGGMKQVRMEVFSETRRWGNQQGVIKDGWKLIYHPKSRGMQLFDLKHDPGETEEIGRRSDKTFIDLQNALAEWDYDNKMKRSRFKVRHPKLSSKDLEKLKSLGYIH